MPEPDARPAFYAARPGSRWREWWTLLHPPYTAWHLSYVVIGASLAPGGDLAPLFGALGAFFLAVGIGAHALDELQGRPLGTSISSRALVAVAVLSLLGAVALGIAGVVELGLVLVPFIAAGTLLALAYNLELWQGRLHNDATFALGWGSFPLLAAYVAEARSVSLAAVLAAAAAFVLSAAQRVLSTRARHLRRSVQSAQGRVVARSGEVEEVDTAYLLAPLERALVLLSWFVVLAAAGLAVSRFG